jgi:hypothetical protein
MYSTRTRHPARPIPWGITWAIALGLVGTTAAIGPACAQGATNAPLEFNIPSQPLNVALGRYGDATGREALYDASLATGRISGDVQGMLAPDEALKRLLSGTGLSAQFVAENAFVLLPAPQTIEQTATTMSPARRRYYGLIQESLLDALCRSRGARPGHYRFVAMFWIDPDGKIEKPQRIGSTGATDADQQVDATLRSVRFSEPPPAGFAQPVLILIVPQAPGVTPSCGKVDSGRGPIGLP